MRISFDLDDTLICYGDGTLREPAPPWYRRCFTMREPLRLGAATLMRKLQESDWDIWIYTTSNRNPRLIRRWIRSYGIQVGRVINQGVYDEFLRRTRFHNPPSKNPGAFGIDLHVDDSEGVLWEGRQHGFRVVVISPRDPQWTEKVLSAAEQILHP